MRDCHLKKDQASYPEAFMAYAIMQKELVAPEVQQLAKAFQSVPAFRALDAQTAANDAFGILMRGLDVETAAALQDALNKHGIETEVIDEVQLPKIPPAKVMKQVDFLPAQLSMYDPMGRTFSVPWRDVLLVAAGNVRLPEYRKAHGPAEAAHNKELLHDGKHRDGAQYHLMLELVLAGAVSRYSMIADEFVFDNLGGRITNDLAQNFTALVRDLAEYAPHAGLNRGAFLICENQKEIFTYPNKAAFFEELTWFLWRTAQAAAGV